MEPGHDGADVDVRRLRVLDPPTHLYVWGDAVIPGQGNDDVPAAAHRKQGVEERAEHAVEPQHVIVNLPRVRTEGVPGSIHPGQ